ncbi:hypothetical protein ACFFX1_07965 [Dactylosporangium sucinum]|uniref:hypothetical protein n=1 Tax=Dactylosporangium sucinum TaxID=1424081 RepID=UPI0035E55A3F
MAPGARERELPIVAAADFAAAVAAHRVPPRRTIALAVAGLAVLAFSTWTFGGVATGTGPFFVLLFAWVGLHHPPWTAVALSPLTAAAYVAPLVATHQPPDVVGSAVVFVPVATAVAEVIARRVRPLHHAGPGRGGRPPPADRERPAPGRPHQPPGRRPARPGPGRAGRPPPGLPARAAARRGGGGRPHPGGGRHLGDGRPGGHGRRRPRPPGADAREPIGNAFRHGAHRSW